MGFSFQNLQLVDVSGLLPLGDIPIKALSTGVTELEFLISKAKDVGTMHVVRRRSGLRRPLHLLLYQSRTCHEVWTAKQHKAPSRARMKAATGRFDSSLR